MKPADARRPLIRGGLAEAALDGRVSAARYAEPTLLQAVAPAAAIRAEPDSESEQLDQLLFGERFEVLDCEQGFAFGRSVRDGCIGWIAEAALGAPALPTHRVQSLRAFAYATPDLAARATGPFAINALVSVDAGQGRFLHDPRAGWLVESDLAPIGQGFEADAAAVALRFLGAPYRWGARDGVGVDAPGLIQLALYACGRACPRALEEQAAVGRAVRRGDLARGDLVIWRNHAGMMLDAEQLLSADVHAMKVCVEPLDSVLARLNTAANQPMPALRRL